MTRSESIKELAAALAKAQGSISGAKKDSYNPFYKSAYADLASVWDSCRDALSSNGLAVIQTPEVDTDLMSVSVTTLLIHASGEWIQNVMTAPAFQEIGGKDGAPKTAKFDVQTVGKTITYLRRYALMAIVGIASEDDDGNAAAEHAPPRQVQQNGKQKPEAKPEEPMKLDPRAKVYAEFVAIWSKASAARAVDVEWGKQWRKDHGADGTSELTTEQMVELTGAIKQRMAYSEFMQRATEHQMTDDQLHEMMCRVQPPMRAITDRDPIDLNGMSEADLRRLIAEFPAPVEDTY